MQKLINEDGTEIEVPDERAVELEALGWKLKQPDPPSGESFVPKEK